MKSDLTGEVKTDLTDEEMSVENYMIDVPRT